MQNRVCLQAYESEDLAELDLEFLKSLGIDAEMDGLKVYVDEADLEDAQEAISLDASDEEHSFDDEDNEEDNEKDSDDDE